MKKNYEVIFYRDKNKKSQKTPKSEIDLAKKYKNDYIERNGEK